jgi:hypothetical protein
MNPNDKRKDNPDRSAPAEAESAPDRADEHGRAKDEPREDKPGAPQKGPGNASADVGMTATGDT